jgi:hypothetical protein
MSIREGPHILEWIKLNGEEETIILWLKDKVKIIASLHPRQSEISQVCKFPKAHVDA